MHNLPSLISFFARNKITKSKRAGSRCSTQTQIASNDKTDRRNSNVNNHLSSSTFHRASQQRTLEVVSVNTFSRVFALSPFEHNRELKIDLFVDVGGKRCLTRAHRCRSQTSNSITFVGNKNETDNKRCAVFPRRSNIPFRETAPRNRRRRVERHRRRHQRHVQVSISLSLWLIAYRSNVQKSTNRVVRFASVRQRRRSRRDGVGAAANIDDDGERIERRRNCDQRHIVGQYGLANTETDGDEADETMIMSNPLSCYL